MDRDAPVPAVALGESVVIECVSDVCFEGCRLTALPFVFAWPATVELDAEATVIGPVDLSAIVGFAALAVVNVVVVAVVAADSAVVAARGASEAYKKQDTSLALAYERNVVPLLVPIPSISLSRIESTSSVVSAAVKDASMLACRFSNAYKFQEKPRTARCHLQF